MVRSRSSDLIGLLSPGVGSYCLGRLGLSRSLDGAVLFYWGCCFGDLYMPHGHGLCLDRKGVGRGGWLNLVLRNRCWRDRDFVIGMRERYRVVDIGVEGGFSVDDYARFCLVLNVQSRFHMSAWD